MPVTSLVASCYTVAINVGVNIAPLVIGQLVEQYPGVLVYSQAVLLVLFATIFIIASTVGNQVAAKTADGAQDQWIEQREDIQAGQEESIIHSGAAKSVESPEDVSTTMTTS